MIKVTIHFVNVEIERCRKLKMTKKFEEEIPNLLKEVIRIVDSGLIFVLFTIN